MPQLQAFNTLSYGSSSRVVLDSDSQLGVSAQSGRSLSRADKAGQNLMTRQVLLNALGRQFGVGVAERFLPQLSTTKALSSREIRGIIAKAGELSAHDKKVNLETNRARLLSVFAGRSDMGNLAFRDRRAVNEVAGRLLANEPSAKTSRLSDADLMRLSDELRTAVQGIADERALGVRDAGRILGRFDVEDRSKAGELRSGDIINGYEFVELKQKGVEPGFVGLKAFTDEHMAQMRAPGPPLHQTADAFLEHCLSGNAGPFRGLPHLNPAVAVLRSLAQDVKREMFPDLGEADFPNPEMRAQFKEALLNDPGCLAQVKTALRGCIPEFSTRHYVKLDYNESDRNILGNVRIPRRTAKSGAHRFFTTHTRNEANFNAIKEVLASDLMRAMGIESQKAKLVRSEYSDGKMKLLIDAEHMSQTGADGQVQSFRDFAGHIVDGFLVRDDDRGRSDTSMAQLGRNKILMLALSDRDALGSRGDNKGRMGNTFAAIDPGHSLEESMDARNIRSDFSFSEPGQFSKFKNYTVFDDCAYMEKMEGVRQLKEMRDSGGDLKVFSSYIGWLRGEVERIAGDPSLGENEKRDQIADFRELRHQVKTMRDAFITRRDYILNDVFGERLPFLDDNPPILENLSNLEKLTSRTTRTSPHGTVQLEHLQVVEGGRQQWHIQRDGEGGYIFQAVSGDPAKARATVNDLLRASNLPFHAEGDAATACLHVPASQVRAFAAAMSEANVIAYKEAHR